jgi:hypothetical protein
MQISLAETLAVNDDPKKHIVFCLPFLMAAKPDDAMEDNGDRLIAIEALRQHKICQSALMELISARKKC